MAYSCWLISEKDRAALLSIFPPKYTDVIAHHITYNIGNYNQLSLPPNVDIQVVGYTNDGIGLEALVVAINGSTKRAVDSKTYHITWSLDRVAGYKPVDSNDIIEAYGWETVDPIYIQCIPNIL